jgi:hypothetical protein
LEFSLVENFGVKKNPVLPGVNGGKANTPASFLQSPFFRIPHVKKICFIPPVFQAEREF